MYKQVILIRKDLKLGAGKIASQTAHAAIGSMKKAAKETPSIVESWEMEGSKKVVLKVSDLRELKTIENMVKKERIVSFLVRDAGLTQVKPSTITALGIGPADEKRIDNITKELKLL
jgi:peptidyl-tRNA hydrolase, PTH2 family